MQCCVTLLPLCLGQHRVPACCVLCHVSWTTSVAEGAASGLKCMTTFDSALLCLARMAFLNHQSHALVTEAGKGRPLPSTGSCRQQTKATHHMQLRPTGRAQLLWLVCVAAKHDHAHEPLLAVLLSQPVSQANCRQHHQQESHKAQQELLCQLLRALAAELRGRQRFAVPAAVLWCQM